MPAAVVRSVLRNLSKQQQAMLSALLARGSQARHHLRCAVITTLLMYATACVVSILRVREMVNT